MFACFVSLAPRIDLVFVELGAYTVLSILFKILKIPNHKKKKKKFGALGGTSEEPRSLSFVINPLLFDTQCNAWYFVDTQTFFNENRYA